MIVVLLINIIISYLLHFVSCNVKEPIQLYYGLDESERSLRACGWSGQACGAVLQRPWRAPAHLRLCRCPRRKPCPVSRDHATLAINAGAYLQFCDDTSQLPTCLDTHASLSVEMSQPDYGLDQLDSIHHNNTVAVPPVVTAHCSCPDPHYWTLSSRNTSEGTFPSMLLYKCVQFKRCKVDEFCGNVRTDAESLYQRCWCPRRHACAHDGGLVLDRAEELLYNGMARKAHCRAVSFGVADEEYYDY